MTLPTTVVGTSAVTVEPASGPAAIVRTEPIPRPTADTEAIGPSRLTSAVTVVRPDVEQWAAAGDVEDAGVRVPPLRPAMRHRAAGGEDLTDRPLVDQRAGGLEPAAQERVRCRTDPTAGGGGLGQDRLGIRRASWPAVSR